MAVTAAVVSSACSIREELPDDNLSVTMAWIQITEGSWEEQQRMSVIMGLVVSLQKAHDTSPTTLRWPDPKTYIALQQNRADAANQAHQRPGVGDGSERTMTAPTAPPTVGSTSAKESEMALRGTTIASDAQPTIGSLSTHELDMVLHPMPTVPTAPCRRPGPPMPRS